MVFSAHESAFRSMFQGFDGVPGEQQSNWYVSRRWDRGSNSHTSEDDAEERLLRFLADNDDSTRRGIRLIYGGTGVGKTTFVHHFFEVYLPATDPELSKKTAHFMVDCAEAAVTPDLLEQDVDRRIHEILNADFSFLEDHPHCLDMWNEECQFGTALFREVCLGMTEEQIRQKKADQIYHRQLDPHNFNRIRINYLRERFGVRPVIVLDNVDQAGADIRRRAILMATHKRHWMKGLKVIICVRDSNQRSVRQEIDEAACLVSDQELHPPDIHIVLARRAETASQRLRASNATVTVPVSDDTQAVLARPDRFLMTVVESLRARGIEKALCDLTNENIRYQLTMVETILRSGQFPREMLVDFVRTYTRDQKPARLSWARFMEALICGRYRFMRQDGEEASLILNLFESGDIGHEYANTLCLSRVIMAVRAKGGRCALSDVLKDLERIGYHRSVALRSAALLLDAKLLRSPDGALPPEYDASGEGQHRLYEVDCTPAGDYYMDELAGRLVYLQHCAVVTSIEGAVRRRFETKIGRHITLWQPGDVPGACAAAGLLIAQVRHDEQREGAFARADPDRLEVYSRIVPSDPSSGHAFLWRQMAIGSLRSIRHMRATWKPDLPQSTWQAAEDLLRAASQ